MWVRGTFCSPMIESISEPELDISLAPCQRLEGTGVGCFLSFKQAGLWSGSGTTGFF